jgi:hypothetical protein
MLENSIKKRSMICTLTEYEDISRSSWTNSVTEYRLSFVTCHCCPCQTIPISSLFIASSVFANAGSTTATDFLQWHVGPPAIFLVCQGHTGSVLLVAAI